MDTEEDLVTVLCVSDPGRIAIAKSLLAGARIPFHARGESLQDIIGGGRLGGVNPITGPVEIQVPRRRAKRARALLQDLEQEEDSFS